MQIFYNKLFSNPIKKIMAFDKNSFDLAFDLIDYYSKNNFYLLGYIKYEAYNYFLDININYKSKLPLLYFEVFKDYKKYEISKDLKNDDNIQIVTFENIDKYKYLQNIEKIKNYISCGITYEVNYTYPSTVCTNCIDDFTLYNFIQKNQKTPYNAFIKNEYETILSFSPELFFKIKNNKIITKPMKGTIKRGKTRNEDLLNINFLKKDIKNIAENVMIVDLLRNDLSKIAKTGTVKVDKLFEVETHPTLHQMTSTISALIDYDVKLYDIFKNLFPCGSISGAPKVSTVKVIKNIENYKRGVYCGAIGIIEPDQILFQVPIRTLYKEARQKNYKVYTGSAIVWDSNPVCEWEETLLKKKFLNTNFKIIETMKVKNKQIFLKHFHLIRLKKTAKKFGFKIKGNLNNLIPKYNSCIMRILLSKNGKLEIEYKKLEKLKTNKIKISKNKVNNKNIFLYHKTTNRMWYEMTSRKISNNELFDEIYTNMKNQITEGTRSNIVIKKDNFYYTPFLKSGLLNGCYRKFLFKQTKVIEKDLYIKDLIEADEIFCINSVRKMTKVELEL